MKLQIKLVSLATMFMMVMGMLGMTTVTAQAHDGEVHSETHTVVAADADVEQMQVLIALLTQLLEVMQQKAAMEADMDTSADDSHDHSAHDHSSESSATLSITVEEHLEETHVHIFVDGVETNSFFLSAAIEDSEAVYAEIAAETDYTAAEVEAAATFKYPEEEHTHDDHAQDLAGIHIMADGSVMLGDGTVLTDATVNAEGMIVLGDGTEVEPEMDMR